MSFFSKVENVIKKLFGSTTWERTAQTTLTVVAPLLETVLTITVGAPIAMKVSEIITQVQNDLAATVVVLQNATSAGSTKATVTNLITAIDSDLSELIADADVKNSDRAAEITAIVSSVSAELKAILAAA